MPSGLVFKGRWNAVTNTTTLINGTIIQNALQDGIGSGGDCYIVYADTSTIHANIYDRNLGSGTKSWIALSYIYYNGSVWDMVGGSGGGGTGTVTSVELSGSTGIAISGTNPITSSGTAIITNTAPDQTVVLSPGVGISISGTYPNFSITNTAPGSSGGGGKTYYLNGSVASGVVGYEQMSRIPVIGAGTDFNISVDGYIASFLTDAGDPGLLNIPIGNWAISLYMQSSSPGGSPYFYVELYKYDSTFTLISSSSTNPEYITNGTAIDVYTTLLSVPATTLAITDRLAIRIYVSTAGRTITLHTEDSNLSQVITTFSTGISAINGLTAAVQTMVSGSTGTNFNIQSSGSTHTFNLPIATSGSTGKLTAADWITFNAKAGAITSSGSTINVTGSTNVDINLAHNNTWTKSQRGAFYSLSVSGSTVNVDMSQSNNFLLVLTSGATLAAPTNAVAGQSGVINVWQPVTGPFGLSYAWCYMFTGGSIPPLSTSGSTVDQIPYMVNRSLSSTVTISNATPAVVTWASHGLITGDKLQLTTTGTLPTGLSPSTSYWVTVVDSNTFRLSTSVVNVRSATFVNTSSAGSGVHTATVLNISLFISPNITNSS